MDCCRLKELETWQLNANYDPWLSEYKVHFEDNFWNSNMDLVYYIVIFINVILVVKMELCRKMFLFLNDTWSSIEV